MPRFIDFRALKERFDLADALRRYGYLDRMTELPNGQLRGPCPVHSTNYQGTSFKVTASRQGFRCFGCGAQGNVLDLVAAVERCDVHRAALRIDEWLGSVEPALVEEKEDAAETDLSEGRSAYESHVYAGLPVYSTRLVRETALDAVDFSQCRTPADLFRFLGPYFAERDREEFVVVLLDTALHVTGLVSVSVGGLSSTVVEPAQVFKPAILANAGSVVLAHNHPSGNVEPSREDVRVTRQLEKGGELLGVPVRDHLVCSGARFVSMAERGLIKE